MQDYDNKVVALTGAASGIGRELVRRFAGAGARLALADVDAERLEKLRAELVGNGVDTIASAFDVRHYESMEDFARRTYETYGGVDLFFNNAGVISVGTVWEQPLPDWDWVIDVNLKGVVHGIKAFVPRMIALGTECRIINTASLAALVPVENAPAYVASKSAVLSLTEVLDLQLRQAGAKVIVHAVCPAVVRTDLDNSRRHRKGTYDGTDPYYRSEDYLARLDVVNRSVPNGVPVADAVNTILNEMERGTFCILTHPQYNPLVTGRSAALVTGKRPDSVAH